MKIEKLIPGKIYTLQSKYEIYLATREFHNLNDAVVKYRTNAPMVFLKDENGLGVFLYDKKLVYARSSDAILLTEVI